MNALLLLIAAAGQFQELSKIDRPTNYQDRYAACVAAGWLEVVQDADIHLTEKAMVPHVYAPYTKPYEHPWAVWTDPTPEPPLPDPPRPRVMAVGALTAAYAVTPKARLYRGKWLRVRASHPSGQTVRFLWAPISQCVRVQQFP